jgi:hypothetical protein
VRILTEPEREQGILFDLLEDEDPLSTDEADEACPSEMSRRLRGHGIEVLAQTYLQRLARERET